MNINKFSILRVAIIAFLVPFCLYIAFLVFIHTRKPPKEPSKRGEQKEGLTKIEKFEMKGLEEERVAFDLNAEKFTQLEEGLFQLEKIHSLTLHTSDNRTLVISGDKGTMVDQGGDNRKILADGNVTFTLEDGTKIQTERLQYDQKKQIVKTDNKVTVKKGEITARASGMKYDLNAREFELAPGFAMEMPKENDTVMIQSASFSGKPNLREGIMKGGIDIRDRSSEIHAAEALIIADKVGEQLKNIMLSGGVSGRSILPGSGNNDMVIFSAEQMEMSFEARRLSEVILTKDISLELQKSGSSPEDAESIACEELTITAGEKGSTKISISGGVKAKFRRAEDGKESEEYLTCDLLDALLSKDRKLENAHAEGSIHYRSGDVRAEGEVADFSGLDSMIVMDQTYNRRPTISTNEWTVSANRIEIKKDSELTAVGQVKSTYKNDGKDAENKGNDLPIFDHDKVVFVASDSLSMRNKNDVLYSGNVRAWQEKNNITSDDLSINLNERSMKARGKVVSRFSYTESQKGHGNETNASPSSAPQMIEIRADSLDYMPGGDRALYKGNIMVRMDERELSCNELEITFSKEGKTERIQAHEDVLLKSPDFSSTGHFLVYQLADRIATVYGNSNPAKAYNAQGKETITAPSLTFHMSEDKMSLISQDGGRTWIALE